MSSAFPVRDFTAVGNKMCLIGLCLPLVTPNMISCAIEFARHVILLLRPESSPEKRCCRNVPISGGTRMWSIFSLEESGGHS